ncbi:MAG TPA: NUDIX domain-containing protein [Longimicrobium sp.]|nr:NUDIX domain-containing protein [Longimicrobium sp.]
MTQGSEVRAKAVAVVRSGDRVLVERGYGRLDDSHFYRAIGGHIDFGERAAHAVAREWSEEYGLTLEEVRLLGVLENFFTYEGSPGHEIVFAFEARVVEPEVYRQEELEGIDPHGRRHEAVWVSMEELATGDIPLAPAGLLALLR